MHLQATARQLHPSHPGTVHAHHLTAVTPLDLRPAWGSPALPLPDGRSSTLSHSESQPLLFPERKRTEILPECSIFLHTSSKPPLCKDLHRLQLYSCTFLISSYCRLWSQCSDCFCLLFFFFINNIYYVCELCIYGMSVQRHICTLKCR